MLLPWGFRVKTFPTAKIRNVALVGHGGAGKTSLAEALLLVRAPRTASAGSKTAPPSATSTPRSSGAASRCRLRSRRSRSDGHKVNVLDAPGYADFVGDVTAALHAADLALFVVSAVEGVEVQTEVAWKLAEQRGIPRAFFINKLDRERASFQRTLDQLKDLFGAGVAPLQLPIGEEAELSGIVELLNDTAITYTDGNADRHRRRDPCRDGDGRTRDPRLAHRRHRHRRRRSHGALPERREDRDSKSSRTRSPTVSRARRCSPFCAEARPSSSASTVW